MFLICTCLIGIILSHISRLSKLLVLRVKHYVYIYLNFVSIILFYRKLQQFKSNIFYLFMAVLLFKFLNIQNTIKNNLISTYLKYIVF